MKRILVAAVIFLALISASIQSANAIETSKVNDALVSKFRYGSVADAKRFIGGHTMYVHFGSLQSKFLSSMPISSIAILYFKTNGQVLGWSDKTDTVEAGTWEIFRRPNQNDFCLHFQGNKGPGLCTFIGLERAPFVETTNGNPFALKAGKPVPYHLGRFGLSLGSIAKKLGV